MDNRQRAVLILAVAGFAVVLAWLVRVATQPSMSLLYAGLDGPAAAEVIAALDARGVAYRLDGTAIYVPDGERDRLRLALAGEGLPATGPAGYELLDNLSGFGTTSEMFDATYWRAKEGELARTLLAEPGIRAARVHIANPPRRPFQRDVVPTASVTLTGRAGPVDMARAEAARHLVASAVAGLAPEQVTVIDAVAGVLLRPGEDSPARRALDAGPDRAAEIKGKLERLMAARVGEGKAVVEVTVETVMESETISERVIDPDSRVAVATDSQEKSETAEGTTPGLTIASNLPDAAKTEATPPGKRNATETRERTNFEVSEVRRERVRMPGDVKKIAVAVLVDGIETIAADGTRSWAPRPAEELAELETLVKAAIGFNAERGDVVTVSSLEFTPPPELGTVAEPGLGARLALNAMTLIQLGVLALVALVLGLFVLRPLLRAAPAPDPDAGPEDEIEAAAPGLLEGSEDIAAASMEASQEILEPASAESERRRMKLREAVESRAEESVEVLRNWLESDRSEEEEEAVA